MTIDPAVVKQFWDQRARRHPDDAGLTNLEEDPDLRALKIRLERERVHDYLGALDRSLDVLDLGGGTGEWAFELAPRVRSVHLVDYCAPLIERAHARALARGVHNVAFIHAAAQEFDLPGPFGLVFISGLLIYLNDDELARLLARLRGYAVAAIVLRDGTGVAGRHEIAGRWSEALGATYAATYRTREQYAAAFASIGFALVRDDDMFAAGCVLDKWRETRLRIYRFERV